jgi:hypothetical protein
MFCLICLLQISFTYFVRSFESLGVYFGLCYRMFLRINPTFSSSSLSPLRLLISSHWNRRLVSHPHLMDVFPFKPWSLSSAKLLKRCICPECVLTIMNAFMCTAGYNSIHHLTREHLEKVQYTWLYKLTRIHQYIFSGRNSLSNNYCMAPLMGYEVRCAHGAGGGLGEQGWGSAELSLRSMKLKLSSLKDYIQSNRSKYIRKSFFSKKNKKNQ